MSERELTSWIDSFVEVNKLKSPEIFCLWTAITTLSGAMERKVWYHTKKGDLFPGLYVLICSPPGIGKGVVIDDIKGYWKELNGHNVASTSITSAAFLDELKQAKRIYLPENGAPPYTFNSLLVCANEFAVFLPQYNNEFVKTLTDLFDAKDFSQKRRHQREGDEIDLDRTHVTLFACVNPSDIADIIPEAAWSQGFMSRTLIIYSDEILDDDIFVEDMEEGLYDHNIKTKEKLITDIEHIGEAFGQMRTSKAARDFVREWQAGGFQPRPMHPRLQHYNTRRRALLLKLAMIACIDVSDSFIIEREHFERALGWLIEAEECFPHVFKAMTNNNELETLKDIWFNIYKYYRETAKQPVPKTVIYQLTSQKLTPGRTREAVNNYINSGILQEVKIDPVKGPCFVPKRPKF